MKYMYDNSHSYNRVDCEETLKQFSPSAIANRLTDLYKDLLRNGENKNYD